MVTSSLVLGLLFYTASVKSCKFLNVHTIFLKYIICLATVIVTWNGTTITGPVLIFQDELVRDDRENVLAIPTQ